ncbi:Stage V sporulation protein AD [Actinobacillus pleuropneumoniae]|nr:Stage V sporulation protein AD [Actinobacillus pleuropneumoniae]
MKVIGQTWQFENKPVIIGTGTIVGPEEGEGPLANDFDYVYDNIEINEKTWEKAERKLLEDASRKAVEKAGIKEDQLQFFVGGDLMNQIISSSFAARQDGRARISACSVLAPHRWRALRSPPCFVDSGPVPNMSWLVRPAITVPSRSSSGIRRNTDRRNRLMRNIRSREQAAPSFRTRETALP